MSVAEWRLKGLYAQDASEVLREIESLGEKVTPHDIVENARDESSVMHSMFEWDDTIAGEKYRESQARHILRSLVIVREDKPEQPPVRLIVSTGESDQSYTPVKFILRKEDEYEALLNRAYAELAAFKRKYATLSELNELLRLIDELI